MKKIYFLLIVFVLLVNNLSFSQETEPLEIKKWTFRSIVFTQPYTFDRSDPLPSFFTGIGGKLNYQRVSYRVSFEHINYVKEVDVYFQKGNLQENTFRLGAEYKMRYYNLIDLNLFVDAMFTTMNQEVNEKSIEDDIDLIKTFDGYAFGTVFGIGFDYYLSPEFSLAIETRLDLNFTQGDYHREDYINNYTVNYLTSTSNFNLKLLGNFSVNYHF